MIWYFFDKDITNKFQTNMVSIQERDGREDWYWAWFLTSYCHIQQWWRPHAEVSCFYSYHYILCIYLSINNHCLENATFDPLHRHCSSENSITYWGSFFPSSYIWGIVLQIVKNEAREITRIKVSPHTPIVRKMPERFGSNV